MEIAKIKNLLSSYWAPPDTADEFVGLEYELERLRLDWARDRPLEFALLAGAGAADLAEAMRQLLNEARIAAPITERAIAMAERVLEDAQLVAAAARETARDARRTLAEARTMAARTSCASGILVAQYHEVMPLDLAYVTEHLAREWFSRRRSARMRLSREIDLYTVDWLCARRGDPETWWTNLSVGDVIGAFARAAFEGDVELETEPLRDRLLAAHTLLTLALSMTLSGGE